MVRFTFLHFLFLLISLSVSAQQFRQRQHFSEYYNYNSFGQSVYVEGDVMVVSDYQNDRVLAYQLNSKNYFEKVQEIVPNDNTGDKDFGYRVSLSGNTLMVSAGSDNSNLGAVYFFERNSSGVWEQSSKVESPVKGSGIYWGGRLHQIKGDIAVTTANNGWPKYFHTLKRQPDDSWAIIDSIGFGNIVSVGSGIAYMTENVLVFHLNNSTNEFVSFSKQPNGKWGNPSYFSRTNPSSGYVSGLGSSIVGNDKFLFIGSYGSDVVVNGNTVSSAGKVFVFENINSAWVQTGEIVADKPGKSDRFGEMLALENGVLAIAAPQHTWSATLTDSLPNAGAVYLYRFSGNTWNFAQKLTASSRVRNGYLGRDLKLNNGNLVMGGNRQVHVFHEGADCMNIADGAAFIDPCSNCASGTSGLVPATENRNCVVTSTLSAKVDETQVFPNPTQGRVNLPKAVNWQVYSSMGTLMLEGNSQQPDLSELEDGIYVLKFEDQTFQIAKAGLRF